MNEKYYNPLAIDHSKKDKLNVLDQIFSLFTSVPGRVSEQNITRLAMRYEYVLLIFSLNVKLNF